MNTNPHRTGNPEPQGVEDHILLLSTQAVFEMDLVVKNLRMNGVDAVAVYPDAVDNPSGTALLYVLPEQKLNALDVLTSLDLTDFTQRHGE